MTIRDFLQGKFEYQFSDLNFESTIAEITSVDGVLTERAIKDKIEVDSYSDVVYFTEKGRDLARAELYDILASVTSGGGRKEARDGFSITERSFSFGITDREQFRASATALRNKWLTTEKEVTFVVSKSF